MMKTRHEIVMLVGALLVAAGLAGCGSAPPPPACPNGQVCGAGCIASIDVCCDAEGNSCLHGEVCCGTGRNTGCCTSGQQCCAGNGCAPANATCCGGGTAYCNPGFVCCNNQMQCCKQ